MTITSTPAANLFPLAALFSTPLESVTRMVRVSDLEPWAAQPRTDINDVEVESLMIALVEAGRFLHELSVFERNDTYQVFIGGRRLRAAKLAIERGHLPEEFKLKVNFYPDITDEQALELANQENNTRLDMRATDIGAYLVQHRDLGSEALYRRTGRSQRDIEAILYVMDCGHADVIEALNGGEITAEMAAMLCAVSDTNRTTLLRSAISGSTSKATIGHSITREGVQMNHAIFDKALFTGKIDQPFGLLDFLGARVTDRDALDEWMSLQEEAALVEAQKNDNKLGWVIRGVQKDMRKQGFRTGSRAEKWGTLAIINPDNGKVSYVTQVVKTTDAKDDGKVFKATPNTTGEAHRQIISRLTTALRAAEPETRERYLLAMDIMSYVEGTEGMLKSRHATLYTDRLEIPGVARSGLGSAALFDHLITLSIEQLRELHTEGLMRTLKVGNATANPVALRLHELLEVSSTYVMNEAYLNTISASDMSLLIKTMPVQPKVTGGNNRKKMVDAILTVAMANANRGFQPPCFHLASGPSMRLLNSDPSATAGAAPAEVTPAVAEVTPAPAEVTPAPAEVTPAPTAAAAAPAKASSRKRKLPGDDVEEVTSAPKVRPAPGDDVSTEPVRRDDVTPAPEITAPEVTEAPITDPTPAPEQTAPAAEVTPGVCGTCGNTREIWDETLEDTAPCPECSVPAVKA